MEEEKSRILQFPVFVCTDTTFSTGIALYVASKVTLGVKSYSIVSLMHEKWQEGILFILSLNARMTQMAFIP